MANSCVVGREVKYVNVTRSSKQPGLLSFGNATLVEEGGVWFCFMYKYTADQNGDR